MYIEKKKVSRVQYHCNKFYKKVNIFEEHKIEIQRWINNKGMHATMHVIPNPDIQVYTDASPTGRGIGSRGLKYKSQILTLMKGR